MSWNNVQSKPKYDILNWGRNQSPGKSNQWTQKPGNSAPPSSGASKTAATQWQSQNQKPIVTVPSADSKWKAGTIPISGVAATAKEVPQGQARADLKASPNQSPAKAASASGQGDKKESKSSGWSLGGLLAAGKEALGDLGQGIREGAQGVVSSVSNVVGGTLKDAKDTAIETFGNMANAGLDSLSDIKNAWEETWGENAEERSFWDKTWHFGGKVAGEGAELYTKLGTEISAGSAQFISQGASRVVGEISPEMGDKIRSAGDFASDIIREGGYKGAEISGDIVYSGFDTAKGTVENMANAGLDSLSDIKNVWEETWGENAEERSFWDKAWHFGGKLVGEGTELLVKFGTELGAGATQFLSQGAGRVADEFSPEWGDKIRSTGQNASYIIRESGYKGAEIGGDIVYSGIDTAKGTLENMSDAFMDFGGDMKELGAETWNDIWKESEDGKKRTGWDILWNLAGGTVGAATELFMKLNADAGAGATRFFSQAAGRIADESSPEMGDKIRSAGDFAANMQRMLGYAGAELGGDMVHGALAGDSIKDPNLAQVAGMVAIGVSPLGPLADLRDFIGGVDAKDPVRVGFSLLGLIPFLGDGAKHGDEFADLIKNSDELVDLLKNSDEIADLVKNMPELAESLKNPEILDKLAKNSDELVGLIQNPEMLTKVLKNPELLDKLLKNPELLEEVLKNPGKLDEVLQNLNKGAGGADDVVKEVPKTKPNQVHHYASDKNKTYTSQFDDIAKKYNLDLDDVWNKESLPHQGRHPNAYHDFVLDQMKNIDNIAKGNKDIFLDLYENMIKSIIRDNPDMLYSEYWKNLK